MPPRLRRTRGDFRAFLFTATGAETDPATLDTIDIFDNLIVECDRLRVLGNLLEITSDGIEQEDAQALGVLLRDIERRTRKVLELAVAARATGGRASRASPPAEPSRPRRSRA